MDNEKEWDEVEDTEEVEEGELSVQELAEAELKYEERQHKHLWDAKYGIV
jgi:hypothetical protein